MWRRPALPRSRSRRAPDRPEAAADSLAPTSADGIRAGLGLPVAFGAKEVGEAAGVGQTKAYAWIAEWKRHGWVEKVGYGQYQRTVNFGQ